jgi:hypothetical protein
MRRFEIRSLSTTSTSMLGALCVMGILTACGGSDTKPAATGLDSGGDGPSGSSGSKQTATGGNKPTAGMSNGSGAGGNNSGGGTNTAGSGQTSAGTSSGGVPVFNPDPVYPTEPAKGTPGVWENVTNQGMDLSAFGVGNIVADRVHPNELYVGGYGSLWKSIDYGLTWNKLDSKPNPPSLALGHVVAVAGTTPPTVWVANVLGPQFVFRSRDGGLTFTLTGAVPEMPDAQSFYSLEVDPNDPNHLITGLHERDGVLESTDAGDTWHFVNGSGWPSGGVSWFIYFVKTDSPETTRKTWFAIAQGGGAGAITRDGGKTWKVAEGLAKAEHPHGNASLFQNGDSLFVAGIYGSAGNGVFRSTDLGDTFTRVTEGTLGLVWGSDKKIYTGWAWACGGCDAGPDGPSFKEADLPDGENWTAVKTPAGLKWGPNSVATTTDGKQIIHVGSMWSTGIWRYVEP